MRSGSGLYVIWFAVLPRLLLAVFVAAMAIMFSPSNPAFAGPLTFTVTRFDDPIPIVIPVCVPNDCSLREAIRAANAYGHFSTVNVPPGNYILQQPPSGANADDTGDLNVTAMMTINGAGADATTINANGLDRVFSISSSATAVFMSDLFITGGDAKQTTGLGGGIYLDGAQLTLTRDEVAGNLADQGGGIYSNGDLIVDRSMIWSNFSPLGAGIYTAAQLSLTNTTIAYNTSLPGSGAGISVGALGSVSSESSTIARNQAADQGGGIYNMASVNDVVLTNTILALNTANTGPNCLPSVGSGGHNLIGDFSDCALGGVLTGVMLNSDPELAQAEYYGGPTRVLAPRSISPAIDAGGNDSCPAVDQRDYQRPIDYQYGSSQGVCDIGAVELQPLCSAERILEPIPDGAPSGLSSSQTLSDDGTIGELLLCLSVGHEYPGELLVTLRHEDTGTTATILDHPSCLSHPGQDIFANFVAGNTSPPAQEACTRDTPAIAGDFSAPDLAAFGGEELVGTWTITVVDDGADGLVGVLERWTLIPLTFAPATPTPSPSPAPMQTGTPTPTPEATAGPTPTGAAVANAIWGDDDCNGTVAATDGLKTLQELAALPYDQTQPCFPLGEVVDVTPAGFGSYPWGDVDCSGVLAATDALAILRHIAALPVNQGADCPAVDAAVLVGG